MDISPAHLFIIFTCTYLNNSCIDFRAQDEIQELKEKLKSLENEKSELSNKMKHYDDVLANIFTEGQIKKLLYSEKAKKMHWSPDDIASAISLRSVSPKAYRYLRANNYPLPAMSTLRKWVSNFNVDQGILKNVLTLMKKKSRDLNNMERLCILSFDEIYVSNKMEIDKKQEQKVGSHKACQTVMVRGLTSHWKQPIYYQYDQPMTRDILEKIISELYKSNYTVVGIVSDMGPGNIKLWSQLNVHHSKNCFFLHPEDNSLKVFVYADVPHLIKLARNHLIDHGFVLENSVVNKDYFESLLDISTSELTFAHKLTRQHLEVKGSLRQRVRLAAELFSNTVAKAIQYCGKHGLMPKNSQWHKAAEIVQLFNDWFDLLNSRFKYNENCPGRNAFGTDLKSQQELLNKVSEITSTMRIGKHEQLIPFQKGILLTNRSLAEMFDYLREKYSVEYILTSRLNQDVLENFFAYIRGMGGANDHPSPLDFRYRMRWFILGKHSAAIFTENRNNEENNEECLVNMEKESSNASNEDVCLTQKILSNITENEVSLNNHKQGDCEEETIFSNPFVEPQYFKEFIDDEDILQLVKDVDVKEKINNESLKYIAGYVAHRFKNKYSLGTPTNNCGNSNTPDWLQSISRGFLMEPSDELLKAAHILDAEFFSMHGTSLSSENKIFTKLAQRTINKLEGSSIPFEVILCLSRTRTYIRLRDLNRRISFQNCQKKLDKKLSKFTNYKK